MNILSWNVNGLRAVVPKLLDGLESFFATYNADIVCFQETKINSFNWLEENLIHVNGYESFWAFPKQRKGWSGVVTYCKKNLTLDAKNSFGVKKFDDEGRIIMTDHKTFVLFNIYFPNAGRGDERLKYKLEFYEWVRKLCLDWVQNQQRNVIVVGDVNTAHKEIDVHRPDDSVTGFLPEERKWIDDFLACGFIDVFRHFHPTDVVYSWWDPKSAKRVEDKGWRLDYAFVNSNFINEVVDCVYLKNVFGSDHCPLLLTLKNKPQLEFTTLCPELSSDHLRKKQGKISAFFERQNKTAVSDKQQLPQSKQLQQQQELQLQSQPSQQQQSQSQPPHSQQLRPSQSQSQSQIQQQSQSQSHEDSRVSVHSFSSKNTSLVRTLPTSLSEPGFQTKRKRKNENNELQSTKKVKPIHSYFRPKNEQN